MQFNWSGPGQIGQNLVNHCRVKAHGYPGHAWSVGHDQDNQQENYFAYYLIRGRGSS